MAYEIPKLLTFELMHHLAFSLKEDYNFFFLLSWEKL